MSKRGSRISQNYERYSSGNKSVEKGVAYHENGSSKQSDAVKKQTLEGTSTAENLSPRERLAKLNGKVRSVKE